MTVQIGLLLALVCAFATNLAFLWKHRGAVAAPDIHMRHPVASAAALFRSKWWAIGFGVALVAWVLHVAALALAPISLVQAVISGGLGVLAVLADRLLRVGARAAGRGWPRDDGARARRRNGRRDSRGQPRVRRPARHRRLCDRSPRVRLRARNHSGGAHSGADAGGLAHGLAAAPCA